MSHVLALASDFIERMANPAYGIKDNEDYAMRFGKLLQSEGFESMLREEVAQIRNIELLSPHGWIWLLSWARSKNLSLDNSLLLDLCKSQSSVFMQVLTIDVATRQTKSKENQKNVSFEAFEHSWLSKLMYWCTDGHIEKQSEFEHIDTRRSEMILVALMQVGSDVTLNAACTLLHHQWAGHNALVKFFWSLSDEWDDETQSKWISRMNMPKRNSDDFF